MKHSLLHLLSLDRATKRVVQVTADIVLIIAVFATSMWIRTESLRWAADLSTWLVLIPLIPITLVLFIKLGFYRAVLRYIAGRALIAIMVGSIFSAVTLALAADLAHLPIPRSVPLIYLILMFLSAGGIRFGFREMIHFSQNRRTERVAIYGAGAAGRQLLQVLHQRRDCLPVAFIDDSLTAQNTYVGGLSVYSPRQIDRLIRDNGVNVLLLALPSISNSRRSEILLRLENYPLTIRSVPGLDDILTGKARIDQISDIGIEDLLGRDPVPPRPDLLEANIAGKVVMVTGAGGSIGSELCRQILRGSPQHIVLFDVSEPALYTIEQDLLTLRQTLGKTCEISPVLGCVKNPRLVGRVMRQFAVQTVYHAAAYKHVPMVEQNIVEGVRNIVFGTQTVLQAAIAARVEAFILISTDKSVRPTNVMGASKRLAELICQAHAQTSAAAATRISMVRFGNVLGSSGSVVPAFRRQIAAGGPITVTHPDITRFFMTIPEAAQLVIQAGAMAKGGEVFVLDMGAPVRIAELAAKMARLHGLRPVLLADPLIDRAGSGEIGIVFTRLRPGEKLHEELLIGNDPRATSHPRIMSATESCQPLKSLEPALVLLGRACDANAIDAIHSLLVAQQTGYVPGREIVDHFVEEEAFGIEFIAAPAEAPRLALLRG